MKLFKLKLTLFFTLNAFSTLLFSNLTLERGSISRDAESFTVEIRNKIWDLEDLADQKGLSSIRSIISFVSPLDSEISYILERQLLLAGINLTKNQITGPYALNPWPHINIPAEYFQRNQSLREPFLETDPETGDIRTGFEGPEVGEPNHNTRVQSLGCLNQHPLRYGMLSESQTENELVLLMNRQLLVFSPRYERIVFAEFIDHEDWVSERDRFYGDSEVAQARTSSLTWYTTRFVERLEFNTAIRGYSKLFAGDFDGDNNEDILVWRKIYNVAGEEGQAGFALLRNEYQHYERDLDAQAELEEGVTGEYLPQETSPEVIQTWLTDRELTWQAGYPTVSECAGEEGNLIPQMHDPLLNDPEVLR